MQGPDFRKPDAVVAAGFSFFGGKAGFRVKGEKGYGLDQRTPFIDGSLEPAQANFEVADALRPMGRNLSAEAIELNSHGQSGAIEDGDGSTR